jgi:hypothetical protein
MIVLLLITFLLRFSFRLQFCILASFDHMKFMIPNFCLLDEFQMQFTFISRD